VKLLALDAGGQCLTVLHHHKGICTSIDFPQLFVQASAHNLHHLHKKASSAPAGRYAVLPLQLICQMAAMEGIRPLAALQLASWLQHVPLRCVSSTQYMEPVHEMVHAICN
jgi:hypothetical protein